LIIERTAFTTIQSAMPTQKSVGNTYPPLQAEGEALQKNKEAFDRYE